MAVEINPYAKCPCGSGKAFKWCCQAMFTQIVQAFELDDAGQHAAALKLMDEVVAQNPTNPEAWGRKALLLAKQGQVAESEKIIDKALEIRPEYPFGLYLKAQFRFAEDEFGGALLLARRAADATPPDQLDALSNLYTIIVNCEMHLNHPLAVRAGMQMLLKWQPANEELPQQFEAIFGENSRFPRCATLDYRFEHASAARREAWDQALAPLDSETPPLGALARAFETLTQEDENDAPAWFNLGLTRAWLGDNLRAISALDRYIELIDDDAQAEEAGALAEVLRCGDGLEEVADYLEYLVDHRIRDPQVLLRYVQEMGKAGRLLPLETGDKHVLMALVLEHGAASALVTSAAEPRQVATFLCFILVAGPNLRLWGPNRDKVMQVQGELREGAPLALEEGHERSGIASFANIPIEGLGFALSPLSQEDAVDQAMKAAQNFFEDVWIHRPLRSLNNNAPVDAAGHRLLRKKLLGAIKFMEDCTTKSMVPDYDFNRLRRKLGLISDTGATPAGGAAPAAAPAVPGVPADLTALGAAELAALPLDKLSDEQLEQAWRLAQKLDAQDLAVQFARTLTARPPQPARPDRYHLFNFLIEQALRNREFDAALDHVNEGERIDCEHNEGKRRNDYELRRAQVHAKRGEVDQAWEVFTRLIERDPGNMKVRGAAAEAMLTARDGAKALRFAEDGLVKARQRNDRDSEQYLMELAGAAKKLIG
jgi:tetratricopeptide (TPR) repeat protein